MFDAKIVADGGRGITAGKSKRSSSRFVRALWSVLGIFFLGIGVVGIVIPLLPTTPLLLLAAACFLRGSERMHRWLLNHRWFGRYIRNYQEGRGIPLRVKVLAIALLLVTISISAVFFVDFLWLKITLFVIAALVSMHIIRLKTLKKEQSVIRQKKEQSG